MEVYIKTSVDLPGGRADKKSPAVQGTWVQSQVGENPTCHGAVTPCVPQLPSTCAATLEANAVRNPQPE